ncbi:MAG TPA: hypothetical protein VFW87_24205, partial [Pirellulales bacterium]|nr:hypothetical protein [Pirellulales bacterium]
MIDDISSGSTLYAQRRAPTPVNCHRRSRFGLAWLVGCLCLAAWIQFRPAVQPTVRGVATTAAAVPVPQPKEILVRKKIEDLQVGERIPGRNPLREQVDLFEPAEADWLKISLRMRQQNGLWLWIDLLRP